MKSVHISLTFIADNVCSCSSLFFIFIDFKECLFLPHLHSNNSLILCKPCIFFVVKLFIFSLHLQPNIMFLIYLESWISPTEFFPELFNIIDFTNNYKKVLLFSCYTQGTNKTTEVSLSFLFLLLGQQIRINLINFIGLVGLAFLSQLLHFFIFRKLVIFHEIHVLGLFYSFEGFLCLLSRRVG